MYAGKTSNSLNFSFYSRKTHFLERFYVFLRKSPFFAQNCQFWPILEVKKSKITTWAIIDILICFLRQNVTQKSIPHGQKFKKGHLSAQIGVQSCLLTVNVSFHVKIIDFRGEKIENHHMGDYRHNDMFSQTEFHPGFDSAQLEIEKSLFTRLNWVQKLHL